MNYSPAEMSVITPPCPLPLRPCLRLFSNQLTNTRPQKEEEERETLALTLRTLRTNEDKQVETIEQLKTKNADLERKNALLESTQRNFASTLRTTEATARQLKDEATRTRTTLSQVRTQCANDIRKRDIQIQKMKERLLDTRGRGTRAPMAQCTVIGGPPNLSSSLGNSVGSAAGAADDFTLAQDTTDFLTKLSQDLADENDNLIALVRTTLSTLKAIQGLPDDDHFLPSDLPAETELDDDASPVVAPPASFDDLTAELDSTLYSLKEVLNQPNYVPLEDLAERDAEIERLVAKNAMLEEEWRKAIALVDGWNKTLGAKFAEVTQEGEGMKSPKKTPGKGKGRALADIIHDGGRQEEQEELELETVVVMGRREVRSELSIVQEEAEEEEEEVEEVAEAEVQEEEELPEIRQPPARMEKKRKPSTPGPTVKAPKPATREAIVPRPRATPTSTKKGKGKQAKAVQSSVQEAIKETAEEAADEAAVEEQILAEVHATPLKTPAKTPAKTPRKTPARKGKRTVRISEAAPEMFSADEMAAEVEEVHEVHEVHEKAGRTPGRKGVKPKSVKKDVQPGLAEVVHEKVVEEPQKTPAKERRGAKRGDRPEVIQEPVEAQEAEPVLEVQQPSARWRAKAGYGKIPEKEVVPVPEAQVSPVKSSRKRKAAAETLEGVAQDSIIVEDAPQGRERKRRARKEDVMPDAETAVQDTEPQAPRGRERGRRTRRGDVTLEADTTNDTANTAADTTAAPQDEEPVPAAPLVLGRKDRRRRPSQARTDMDELLELALLLPSPSPEPEIIAEEDVPEPSNRRERRSRAKEADESMAEDTFARLETPKRTRRPSRSRKEVQEDSAMLDELASEPVLLHYHEVSNEAQTVGVKNHEEAGGKLSRARRRSLRNVRVPFPSPSLRYS